MSQRVHRTIVVCVALVGCDAPAPAPATPAAQPIATPTATPTPEPAAPVVAAQPEAEPSEQLDPPPPPKREVELAVRDSMNELTIGLQRALTRQPGNVFASGMSVAVGVAMVHAGSGGKTAKELAKLLHLEQPAEALYPGYAGLAARWTHADAPGPMVMASRLFGEEKFAFKPAYLDLTRTVFAAPLVTLDFQNDPSGARDHINGWVRAQTRDKISDILQPGSVTAATRLVLANAVYFKADWLVPFDAAQTAPQQFYTGESRREVPMMRSVQRLKIAFGKAGKLRVLELPYKGGEYSMVIVLPGKLDGLREVERTFSADKLQSWIDAGKETAVDLQLPRFTLDGSFNLAPALQRLGATTVFDPKRADLGGMAIEKLALSGVYHRAHITVEERGTEAAAATAIEVSVGGAPSHPQPFIVDRPFLFYIRDMRTGVLLFFGRVTDPT